MIKVLIIDDEPLVRMGMRSIIAWEEHGFKIVGEAGNGVQGLEKIRECEPDLVLIDIMMPQMDGLTVIKEAKKRGFWGKFIILSCVSEIEYLQKAIRAGVSSYVLKSSVNPQEILDTVKEASEELVKNKESSEEIKNYYGEDAKHFALREFLNLILKKVLVDEEEIEQKMQIFGFPDGAYAYLLVCSVQERGKDAKGVAYRMRPVGVSMMEEYWGTCFVSYEDYLVSFLAAQSLKDAEGLALRLQASARQYFDAALIVKIQKVDTSKWDIAEHYELAKQDLQKSFFESGELNVDKEYIPATEFASYAKLSAALEMIKNMLPRSRTVTEYEAKKIYASAVEYVVLNFELGGQEEIRQELQGCDTIMDYYERLHSFEEVHRETLRILKKYYELAEQKGYTEYEDELTDSMIKFIHSHCNSKISTRDVAEYVHFSVDYTCKYFKRNTRTNLTDYILKLKVHRSRKELMEGKSMAEIAELYGFSSDGHYLKVFKKYEGITPGAYVRKNRK